MTQSTPPCSEAEHAELAAWFAVHEAGLDAVAKQGNRDGLMSVGNGRRIVCWYVRYDLRAGPRGEGSAGSPRTSASSRPGTANKQFR